MLNMRLLLCLFYNTGVGVGGGGASRVSVCNDLCKTRLRCPVLGSSGELLPQGRELGLHLNHPLLKILRILPKEESIIGRGVIN